MPPKVKPRIWCGMPIPVRVGFCLMRRAGRREKARRLIVLPLFHVLQGESPHPDTCREGALGRSVQPSDRIF